MVKVKRKKSKSKARHKKDGLFKRLDGFLLNTVEDSPDIRDYVYQPTLLSLPQYPFRHRRLAELHHS